MGIGEAMGSWTGEEGMNMTEREGDFPPRRPFMGPKIEAVGRPVSSAYLGCVFEIGMITPSRTGFWRQVAIRREGLGVGDLVGCAFGDDGSIVDGTGELGEAKESGSGESVGRKSGTVGVRVFSSSSSGEFDERLCETETDIGRSEGSKVTRRYTVSLGVQVT